MVFNARPPFDAMQVRDTGTITNHVNIVRTAKGQFAYVTAGGSNTIKVFRTDNFEQVASSPSGRCRMASGRRATAAASKPALRMPMRRR